MTSQAEYAAQVPGEHGNSVKGTVSMSLDAAGVPQPLSAANPTPVGVLNVTATGPLTSLASTLAVSVGPVATVGVQVANGAGYTLVPEASMDGGVTWIAVGVIQAGSGATSAPVATITASGNWEFSAGGYTNFRLRNTVAASSGTVTGTLAATAAQKFVRSVGIGDQADGAATSDTGSFSLISLIKRLLGKSLFTPSASLFTGTATGATGNGVATAAATDYVAVLANSSAQYIRIQNTSASATLLVSEPWCGM
jgi:hypothetical protein